MLLSSVVALVPLLAAGVSAMPLVIREDLQSTTPRTTFLPGINIAGFDFGMDKTGAKNGDLVKPDMAQIKHFTDQGVKVIRLPFRWEYIEPELGKGVSQDFMASFEPYIKGALDANAYVILDLHNYARYNGKIVGTEGGPSVEAFAAIWAYFAEKYATNNKIIFGLMNEPYEMPNNDQIGPGSKWFEAVQAAVNVIREKGAKTQWILLCGTGYTGAGSFSDKNFPALSKITDPLGHVDLLAFDIHQYLDEGTAGVKTECDLTRDYVQELFVEKVTPLLGNRKAFISEIGGGNTESCVNKLGAALKYFKENSDKYIGWTVWSAGAFAPQYELSLTPVDGKDAMLWAKAILPVISG